MADQDAAQAAMRKLDEFAATLPPGEQEMVADLVRAAVAGVVDGDRAEVGGFMLLPTTFLTGISRANTPTLASHFGEDSLAIFAMGRRMP